jgi:hypothetical protein
MTLLNVQRTALESAAATLTAAERLPRERLKEGKSIPYDLRPLLLDIRAIPPDPKAAPPEAAAAMTSVWMRLRHTQDRGSGRAEEVVAALADEMGLVASPASGGVGGEAEADETRAEIVAPAARAVIEVIRPVRERLWLVNELDSEASSGGVVG